METPIEVLRVEQIGISKELGRFRACDPETRCLYCREWAQYIYKKHFVWNAKTQEEVPENQLTPTNLTAGKYQINFIIDKQDEVLDDQPVYKKERSALMSKKFENLVESWSSNQPNEESLITQILKACQLWMTLPSGYSGLPNLFEPVEFNPYPDAIPLVDDPKDPSQLLDPLIIERQALCLPSDCFHLLKNLTGDILLSHTTPTCNHTKPTAKTPTDLELDRAIFNEHESVAVKKALAELTLALEHAWHPLNNFLDQLAIFEKRRDQLMGKGCQATIDAFFAQQKYASFVDIWATEQSKYKNKKSTSEEIAKVDSLFEHHLTYLKSLVRNFMDDFVPIHLKEIHALTTDLWKMIVPTIYEMGERMAAHEDHKGNKNANATKIGESLKALDMESLKKMESSKEVDLAQKRIIDSLTAKIEEYINDIDNLLRVYRETSRPSLSGKLEKLNNKDFKKKIKKLESGYYTIRQTFRYEVTENIFSESLFCKFSLVCLEPLMQEGEVMEAVTIEKEVKRFVESHKDLLKQRCSLLLDFEEGVQTGRRELAGVLGKLFLKEGMRIQGDNLALKRQNSLLKSMGVTPEEHKKKNKVKKKTSATSSGTSTPALVVQEEPGNKATTLSEKKKNMTVEKKESVRVSESEKSPTKKATDLEPVKPKTVPTPTPTQFSSPPRKPASVEKKIETPLPVVDMKSTPVVTEKKKQEPTLSELPKKSAPVAPVDEFQDWDALRASVLAAENTKQETVVKEQNWDTLKAEALQQKESITVEAKATSTSTELNKIAATTSGWSTIAAKKPADNGWSSNTTPEPSSVGWSSVAATKKLTVSTWSSVAIPTTTSENSAADDSLVGWKTPSRASQVSPTATSSSSNDWSTAATGGWNTPADIKNDGWNNSPVVGERKVSVAVPTSWGVTSPVAAEKKAAVTTSTGWGVTSPVMPSESTTNTDSDLSLGGWGNPSVGGWNSRSSSKTSSSNTWSATPAKKQSNGWNGAKLPWEEESANTAAIKSPPPIQAPAVKHANEVSAPPGISSNAAISAPPGMAAPANKAPPGLPAASATTTKYEEPVPPTDMPTPTTSTPLALGSVGPSPPSFGASLVSTISQLQDPLPANLNELDAASLLVITMNLHRENGALIQSVYTMQQEMSMMSKRYAEVMNLARERETQTLALFESRKQTEMEEARRYVLSLEARVKQLEEQLKGNNATTAGFGNQDLFAGYREEMSTGSPRQNSSSNNNNRNNHGRKLWQKNTVVRCGNCGEVGHASAECKSYCRYCGSLEHLSEACPMN